MSKLRGNMNDYQKIAELIFPGGESVDEILKRYPPRKLKQTQQVTRFAPSPTGFMHIGNFFPAFISYNLAKQSQGIFYLRFEDTDSKREIKQAKEVIYEILEKFDIFPDEYQTLDGKDVGDYGPYVQSQRGSIYRAFAKKLVAEGKAFPCFCRKTEGKEDVLKSRQTKFEEDDEKEYDPCRNLSYQQVKQHLDNGEKFAIRLKTKNDGSERVKFFDLIKGEIEAKANSKDFILLKNDGIPPYAFAHAIDDTLMGTTIVVRGEEYISSTPMHIELFEALGFKPTCYCHNPLIWKIDENGNKRKISKRNDPEADMRFYFQQGYPKQAVLEYLLNLINSGFEIWRKNNPDKEWTEYNFGIKDITTVAPVFDIVKLSDISKNIIAGISGQHLYQQWLEWAGQFDKNLASVLTENKQKFVKLCKMERDESAKPRKDIYNLQMMKEYFSYAFEKPNLENIAEKQNFVDFIKAYLASFKMPQSNEEWFAHIKMVAAENGFATDNKLYKQNPEAFRGNIAKACLFARQAITGKDNGPSLYYIIDALGQSETLDRLERAANLQI